MSLLLKICEVMNEKYLEPNVRFKGIIEKPRIFTMVHVKQDEQETLGFYHICNPRSLLAQLLALEFSTNADLNVLLNNHVARITNKKVTNTPEYNKVVTSCGKCGTEVPRQLVGKLDIIENAGKLTLR